MKRLLIIAIVLIFAVGSLTGQEIVTRYDRDSRYYRIIVRDFVDQNRRILYFSRTRTAQTRMIIDDPITYDLHYLRTLKAGFAIARNPDDVLVIGLGGGAIPKFLSHHYPSMRQDLVEIDPDVVRVAQEYFAFEPSEQMRVFAVDGRLFLREVTKTYDVIVLDAYGADRIPFHLTTQEFFSLVRERLNPGGVVVMNLYEAFVNRFYESILKTMQSEFNELYLFQTYDPLNKVAIATVDLPTMGPAEWLESAREFIGNRSFDFDLPAIVRDQYRRVTNTEFGGEILIDDHAPVDLWRTQE